MLGPKHNEAPRVAYVEQATQFLQTYTPDTGTTQVDDRVVDFSMQVVARHLKLPMNGMKLEEMPGLSKKQYENPEGMPTGES